MKVHFSMAKLTDKEFKLIQVEQDMKVHLSMTKDTDKEFTLLLMEQKKVKIGIKARGFID